ncbi:MAG: squalene/phytoene synthase family protein, partial [Verrucomicrobiae bacterium]|nr:squalene/phytoene synthase family protein [Verrucomicrobiae bacterium]NNJ86466.1 squalene/phytoene synthase family protein [Akkermansiaceae bacterium]
RVYLPTEAFNHHGYSEQDLENKVYNEAFINMMSEQAERAESLYQQALQYFRPEDAKALKAAEAMRKIYHALLDKMRADGFKVLNQRYSLSKFKKTTILLGSFLGK